MAPGFVTSIAQDCSTTSQTLVIGLFVFALCDFVQLAKVGLCATSHKQHITTSKGRAHCHRSLFHVGVRDLCVMRCHLRCDDVCLVRRWRSSWCGAARRPCTRDPSVSIGVAYEIRVCVCIVNQFGSYTTRVERGTVCVVSFGQPGVPQEA